MENFVQVKEKSIKQIKEIVDVLQILESVVVKLSSKENSYKVEKLFNNIRKEATKNELYKDGFYKPSNSMGLNNIYQFKSMLAKKLAEMVNTVLDSAPKNSNSKVFMMAALDFESLLERLGYTLFELQAGQVYDPNIDDFYATVTNKEEIKSAKGKPLYVLNSDFGCAEKRGESYGKVIEKAKVELTDDLSITQKRASKKEK